jgi:hypothetical protein
MSCDHVSASRDETATHHEHSSLPHCREHAHQAAPVGYGRALRGGLGRGLGGGLGRGRYVVEGGVAAEGARHAAQALRRKRPARVVAQHLQVPAHDFSGSLASPGLCPRAPHTVKSLPRVPRVPHTTRPPRVPRDCRPSSRSATVCRRHERLAAALRQMGMAN